jgi:dienelactone hydrolase
MKKDRRDFIKMAGLAGAGLTTGNSIFNHNDLFMDHPILSPPDLQELPGTNLIGPYGHWAAGLLEKELPSLSFRRKEFTDAGKWREEAKTRLAERLAIPFIGKTPTVKKLKEYTYDGLHIEEMTWQLPYGRPTEAILLKPQGAKGKLPGILAFHDHGGNKYFGTRKITKTSDKQHPLMTEHQKGYYEGRAWANEIAKRGYVVLVSDAFPFASRRVMMQDIPVSQRKGLTDENPEDPKNIQAYNSWAGEHEHIMAKSLFSAGTTWPGVFLAEDQKALDILSARNDVDSNRLGCAGLSGGGMRTVFAGGFDSRIKCAVCVGFMTTWRDLVLYKSFTHTWMTYVPVLPKELDFPEILGLRAPLPSLVLNDSEDQLFTIGEMRRAEDILREIYGKAGAPGNFKCSFHPGPHKFDAAMQDEAFNWFDRWLKNV